MFFVFFFVFCIWNKLKQLHSSSYLTLAVLKGCTTRKRMPGLSKTRQAISVDLSPTPSTPSPPLLHTLIGNGNTRKKFITQRPLPFLSPDHALPGYALSALALPDKRHSRGLRTGDFPIPPDYSKAVKRMMSWKKDNRRNLGSCNVFLAGKRADGRSGSGEIAESEIKLKILGAADNDMRSR